MGNFKVGNKVFYEILSLEFVKSCNALSLRDKAACLKAFASADVEANTLLYSAHSIVASTLEAM